MEFYGDLFIYWFIYFFIHLKIVDKNYNLGEFLWKHFYENIHKLQVYLHPYFEKLELFYAREGVVFHFVYLVRQNWEIEIFYPCGTCSKKYLSSPPDLSLPLTFFYRLLRGHKGCRYVFLCNLPYCWFTYTNSNLLPRKKYAIPSVESKSINPLHRFSYFIRWIKISISSSLTRRILFHSQEKRAVTKKFSARKFSFFFL